MTRFQAEMLLDDVLDIIGIQPFIEKFGWQGGTRQQVIDKILETIEI